MSGLEWYERVAVGFLDLRWFATVFIAFNTGCQSQMAAPEKSLSLAEAKAVAIESLDEVSGDHQFVILDDKTITKEYGWVFFYDTDKAIESGDEGFTVPSLSPPRRPMSSMPV